MHRSWLFVLVLLLISAPSLGQSNSSDSQGMQALVAEVRQLRKNLQTTNGYALKSADSPLSLADSGSNSRPRLATPQ